MRLSEVTEIEAAHGRHLDFATMDPTLQLRQIFLTGFNLIRKEAPEMNSQKPKEIMVFFRSDKASCIILHPRIRLNPRTAFESKVKNIGSSENLRIEDL